METPEQLKELVRKHWTEQLYIEYAAVLYHYSVTLPQPFIAISDHVSTWGSWNAATRTILISARLIETYAWDIVIEILKHEMAHQWVSFHYGNDDAPHGERFVTACRRLGVAAWAARATGELPHEIPSWRDRALSIEEERLLKRVEKLLALATSANEHEALLAMQRVRELYARYNLDRLRGVSGGGSEVVHLLLTRGLKRFSQAESMIFSILTEHFFVRVLTCKQYDAATMEMRATAEVSGTRENVLMAEYVYRFLWSTTQSLWDAHRLKTGASAKARASYVLGVLAGFHEKLKRERADQRAFAEAGIPEATGAALVARAGAEVDAYISARHPKIVTRSWSSDIRDSDAYFAGRADGRRVTLNKPIEQRDGSRGRLLT